MPLLPSPHAPAGSPAPSDEDVAVRRVARRAEDAGDLIGARRLLGLLGDSVENRVWSTSLEAGLRCRDDAERALWLLQPAFRYGFAAARRRVLEGLAADVLRGRGVPAVTGDVEVLRCALQDPLLVDAGLFDLGMLADYVTNVLVPDAHPLGGPLSGWVGRPVSVWEVRSADDRVTLRHLLDGTESVLRDPPANPDGLLYGRLVPVGPEWVFPLPPVTVDRLTARRVLRAVRRGAPLGERLRAVASYQRQLGPGGSR